MEDFIKMVRQYALDHYNTGGWDEIVEAWTDSDLLEYYSNANGNAKKAFKALAKTVKLRSEYAEDISNTAF